MHDYVTGRGESVPSVAGKFQVAPEALRRLNGLAGDALREGERLRVPVLIGRTPQGDPETLARSFQIAPQLVRKTPDGDALLLFIDE